MSPSVPPEPDRVTSSLDQVRSLTVGVGAVQDEVRLETVKGASSESQLRADHTLSALSAQPAR